MVKGIYKNPTVNIILNGERPNAFSLSLGTRQEHLLALTTSIQALYWRLQLLQEGKKASMEGSKAIFIYR